jgi:hypothetical protein
MLKSGPLRWPVVLVVIVIGVAIVAVADSVGPFSGRRQVNPSLEPVPQPIPSSQVLNPSRDPVANPPPAPERTKPVYEGPLGDFIVGIHQGSSAPPCPRPLRPAKNEKIKASDLYSPVFGQNLEGFVFECADGRIVAIEIYGMETIGKGYFIRKPIITFEAPLDGLQLLTVAGKPALAQLPMPGFHWFVSLVVIERFPDSKQPGIFVEVVNMDKSLKAAKELAAQIMGVRP